MKLLDFLVRKRIFVLSFFFILAIGSVFLIRYVNINYDISSYLAKDSNTRISLEVMNSDFESNGSFQLMVENIDKPKANKIKEELSEIEGIKIILFDSDSTDYYHDNYALYNIFLKESNFNKSTRETVNNVKELLKDEKIYLTGGAVESLYLGDEVNNDMYMILLVAIIIVFIVLIINSVSWIEPVIFMIVIGVAIVINLGTNAFLPSISFVTGSICAVMQLALAMDYSIMLLHRYVSEKENNPDLEKEEVVKIALRKSIMPILSSGLTTIAGLLALILMTFKIGIDIGIVLSKGIVISLIVVIFFMPGLLVIFSKLIDKTKHRNIYQIIRQKFPKLERGVARYQYKSRFIAFGLLIGFIVVGFIFYLKTNYIYTLEASNDYNSVINIDKRKIEEEFGIQNNVVILLPKAETNKEEEVVNYLNHYDYNGSNPFTSIQSITTSGLNDYYDAKTISVSYNLPLTLIEEVYKNIDNTRDKFKLKEVIDYLNESTFIDDYTNDLRDELNKLYDVSLLLDKTVNSEDLAKLLTDYTKIEFSKDNAQAIINCVGDDYNFKDFIIKINEEELFLNIYNNYKSFVVTSDELESTKTKEEVLEVFTLDNEELNVIFSDNEVMIFKEVIIKIDSTKLSSEDLAKYDYYAFVLGAKDELLTKEQAITNDAFNYTVLPSSAFIFAYLGKDKATNYAIQKSLVSLLESKITDASATLAQAASLVSLVDSKMTVDILCENFSLPTTFIAPIYQELGASELTGKEILSYVKEHDYISVVSSDLKKKLVEAHDTIEYAIATFVGENYTRIVMSLSYSRSSQEAIKITRNLQTDLKDYYDNYYVASECGAFADFEDTFNGDSIKISIASVVFILLIIAISFRSFAIPIILTFTIQGAIWFTMAISVWARSDVYFICYLMIVCIQMGTTIDYGILYTSKYLEERRNSDVENSLTSAFHSSITTILTSGSILVLASFVVGLISKVSIISSIGYLLSVGTIVSLTFILFALPQVLIVSEPFIELATYGYKNKKNVFKF